MNTDEMLSVMIVTFQSWLDFQTIQYAKEGKEVDDSSHIIQLPKYPSRAVVEEWIKILRYAAEESSQVTDLIALTADEEQMVSIIWQAFPEYFDGAVEGQNYGDSEKLTRLARELAKHVCQPQWIDMESAPKDGTEILLKVENRAGVPGKYLVGHYMKGGHCIEDHPPINSGWYFWNGCMFDRKSKPISWMPLPNARKYWINKVIDAIFEMRHRLNRNLDAAEIADMLKELK